MGDQFMEDYKRDTIEGLAAENARLRSVISFAAEALQEHETNTIAYCILKGSLETPETEPISDADLPTIQDVRGILATEQKIATLRDIPKQGIASLYSWADGKQHVALSYDLGKRGNRQAIVRYYEHEIGRGREAIILLDNLDSQK